MSCQLAFSNSFPCTYYISIALKLSHVSIKLYNSEYSSSGALLVMKSTNSLARPLTVRGSTHPAALSEFLPGV